MPGGAWPRTQRCSRTAQESFVLDNPFALIEGHPQARRVDVGHRPTQNYSRTLFRTFSRSNRPRPVRQLNFNRHRRTLPGKRHESWKPTGSVSSRRSSSPESLQHSRNGSASCKSRNKPPAVHQGPSSRSGNQCRVTAKRFGSASPTCPLRPSRTSFDRLSRKQYLRGVSYGSWGSFLCRILAGLWPQHPIPVVAIHRRVIDQHCETIERMGLPGLIQFCILRKFPAVGLSSDSRLTYAATRHGESRQIVQTSRRQMRPYGDFVKITENPSLMRV